MAEFHYIGTHVLLEAAMRGARAAVNECAEDLAGKAQDAAPVDTGTLRASIHVDKSGSNGLQAIARVSTGGEANEYAVYQHEGTSRGVPATKFLEGPLIANQDAYREAIRRGAAGAL